MTLISIIGDFHSSILPTNYAIIKNPDASIGELTPPSD
jgi:hypothetical protein